MAIKYLGALPLVSVMDDNEFRVCMWDTSDVKEFCEFENDECIKNGLSFGTDDSNEPKFCQRHYFGDVNDGDGVSNYKLIYRPK